MSTIREFEAVVPIRLILSGGDLPDSPTQVEAFVRLPHVMVDLSMLSESDALAVRAWARSVRSYRT